MIRCVMFDFGNVLMHFDTQRFYDFVRTHQRPGSLSPENFFHSDICIKYDLGKVNEFEFFETTKQTLGIDVGIEQFFFEFTTLMRPDLRMIALRQVLKQNGVKVAVVSNISRYHYEYARRKWPEVFMGFDYLALSFRMKARKPDHRMYNAPAKRLGIPPERCLLIDDLKINTDEFERWGGVGHHYNVVNDDFCSNGRLDKERNRLLLRMVNLGMLTLNQAGGIARVDLAQLE